MANVSTSTPTALVPDIWFPEEARHDSAVRIEEFSLAVIAAMAAQIGVQAKWTPHDHDTTDVELEGRRYSDASGEPIDPPSLKIQVKATATRIAPLVTDPDHFSFQIPTRKNWDDLRLKTGVARILVVVECPLAERDRVGYLDRHLLLSARAWWLNLRGMPAMPEGLESKAVRIPLAQRLTPATLASNVRSIA